MRNLLPALLLLVPACAEITSALDGGVSPALEDALVGGGGEPRPDAGPPAPDAGPPVPDAGSSSPCGAPVCAACGMDGLPRPLADDPRCPALDCSSFDTYVRTTEGGAEICIRNHFAPVGGRCLAPGRCREAADAAWCADRNVEEAARNDRPCQAMQGCADATPPSFTPAPEGTPCAGGRCDAAGACLPVVEDERCDPFVGRTVCRTGVHTDGTPYCEVATADGTCNDVCAAAGSHCVAASAAGPAACQPGDQRGCFDAGGALLCRCAVRRE
jgi:hypothetical protein